MLLNASLNGKDGNTAVLLEKVSAYLGRRAHLIPMDWNRDSQFEQIVPCLQKADAIIIGTGTHWDSWSHSLQYFLELATPTEGSDLWLGKPAGVVVSMHSVGGKGVLSRLQGVLNTFGCLIPPMSGVVCSLVNEAAIESKHPMASDLWSIDDLDILCHNVLTALKPRPRYKAWPVDRIHYSDKWVKVR